MTLSKPTGSGREVVGSWQVLPFDSEVLAVHAALMHSGKVLFAAGSGNSDVRFNAPAFGDTTVGNWTSVVWDPTVSPPPGQDTEFFHPDTPRDAQRRVLDFFCGGETVLADGRVLSTGGTLAYDGGGRSFAGRPDTALFSPATKQWAGQRPMAHGRWYPSVIILGDGRILVAAGLDESGTGARNTTLETFSAAPNHWHLLPMPANFHGLPLYAHLYLLGDGSVCYAGGHMDDGRPGAPVRLDLTRSPATVTPIPGLSNIDARDQCASVLLPPAQAQQVMIIGGAPGPGPAIADVEVVDFTVPAPAYRAVAPLQMPRKHPNATLLPDRTVLVTGGSRQDEQAPLATNHAEVFDPAHPEKGWTQLAEASITRMYHSVALLLPDGRVVTAGGNPHRGQRVGWEQPPDANEEMHLEVYSPAYLFRGPRPTIGSVPAEWRYGQSVDIACPQAATINFVSLIRPGATTHSFNTSQRLVDLPITARSHNSLTIEVTDQPNLAPPGWYMLFLTDTTTVPSVAQWVHLAGAPASATPASAYAQAVLTTAGLVAYWPLAETSGTVAFDVAGTLHGSYYNGPRLGSPGPGGASAVTMNGVDQYVLVPRDVRDDFSLEVSFSAHGGVGAGVTQWWQGAGLLDGEVPGVVDDFGISLDATGQVWAGTGNPDTSVHSRPGLNDGAWHHVVFTRTRTTGTLKLYIDGAPVATAQAGTQPLTAPPALRIGALQSGVNHLAGTLADAAIYHTALPAPTVAAHFHART